jgi:hypothetical protein
MHHTRRDVLIVLFLLAGCGVAEPPRRPEPAASPTLQGGPFMSLEITSTAFAPGASIPTQYTGEGPDLSPPLRWTDVPDGTKELAIVCDDPDAPGREPWVHWVMYGLSPALRELPEGVGRETARANKPPLPPGARHGRNSWPSDNLGYRGPMPPPGHGVHHYHFKLYALDAELQLAAGATKAELLAAIDGHVLAQGELVGTYERRK